MYRLVIAPSILEDGTHAVLATLDDDAAARFFVRGRFAEIEDAITYANCVHAMAPDSFHDRIKISEDLERCSRSLPDESAGDIALNLHKLAETERSATWSRRLDGIPILFATALLVYFTWTEIFGGDLQFRQSIAHFSPIVLALMVLSNYVRARRRSKRYTEECALVVRLALQHQWRREDFFPLLVALERPGDRPLPILLYSGWLFDIVPRGFEQIGLEFMYRPPKDEWGHRDRHELANWLRNEDFEARIHALAELHRSDEPVRFSALRCLATSRRAIRRARALADEGIASVAYLDTVALPGFDDDRIRHSLVPIIIVPPTIIGAALSCCFLIAPWSGPQGIGLMAAVLSLSTIPIIVWNSAQLLRNRGLPKGISLVDLSGDMLLNRGI